MTLTFAIAGEVRPNAMHFGHDDELGGEVLVEGWPCADRPALEAVAVVLNAVLRMWREHPAGRRYGTLVFEPPPRGQAADAFWVEVNVEMGAGSLPVGSLAREHVAMFFPGGTPWWLSQAAAPAAIVGRVLTQLIERGRPAFYKPGHDAAPGGAWEPLLVDLRDIFDRSQRGEHPLTQPRRPRRRGDGVQLGMVLEELVRRGGV